MAAGFTWHHSKRAASPLVAAARSPAPRSQAALLLWRCSKGIYTVGHGVSADTTFISSGGEHKQVENRIPESDTIHEKAVRQSYAYPTQLIARSLGRDYAESSVTEMLSPAKLPLRCCSFA